MAAADGEPRPRIRVAALIVLDDRVVLARHLKDGHRYHLLPGGGVSHGEPLDTALIREVAEETGLEIRVGRPVILSDTIDPNGSRHVVNIVFLAERVRGTITAHPHDDRVEAVDLIAAEDLGDLDLRPPIAGAIQAVLSDPEAVEARYLGSMFVP